MAKQETCPNCGAVYEVTEVKVIFRDHDSYECNCGHTMARWNGSSIPEYQLIAPGRPANA
jgi:transposase-like protein